MKEITRQDYLQALETIRLYVDVAKKDIIESEKLYKQNIDSFLGITKNHLINNCGLSVRAINALKGNINDITNWSCISELEKKFTEQEMYGWRNCGRKSIQEISKLFNLVNLNFKENK